MRLIVGHGVTPPCWGTGGWKLLRPSCSVPNPGVTKYCSTRVSSKQKRLSSSFIECHGVEVSCGRTGRRELLDPVLRETTERHRKSQEENGRTHDVSYTHEHQL
jgi:hypothetical protein